MKILVVEDDEIVAKTLKLLLSSYSYAVDIAADGEAGLQMTEAFEYDLILLDVILPKLDGISLCQQLRSKGFQVPILLLTGQGEGRQKAIALNAGADDYVVKPFDSEELMARIQALLRRGNSISQPLLTWGDLCIDPSSRKVTYGMHLLSVTPKEYAILELFLRNSHKVFSSRAILDHVWNSIDVPSDEAVRVHIKEIRQKLQAVGAPKDFIKTVYQAGYRLNPLYSPVLAHQVEQRPTLPKIAELTSVNQELRTALEQLRSTQAELEQKHQELEHTYQTLQQERQQLQASRDELELRVAERTIELQQREAFLRSIYDGAAQPIFVVNVTATQDFHYVSFNCAAQQVAGVSLEVMGKTPEELFGAEIGALLRRNYERCVQAGSSITCEDCFHYNDGLVWTLTTLAPLRDADGQINRIVGSVLDITDRKQLELSLQASEAKLSQILDSAIVAIASFYISSDRAWEYDYFSSGCEVLFGYSLSELMAEQMLWFSRVHPDDRDTVLMPLFEDFYAERNITAEFRFYRKDGCLRWISSTHASRRLSETRWQVTVVSHDITDRKQAELTFQQQMLQQQVIAEISQDIRRSLDLDEVLSRTVERVRELLKTDRVIIFCFDANWQGKVIMESVGTGWSSILATTISDPCFRDRYVEPYRQGRIASLCDIDRERLEPCYADLLRQFQVKANLVVPILQAENLWGLLIVHHCTAPRQWQPSEMELLRQLANQVGIAIQQSELYQQTRHELIERERMQAVLEESEERFRTLSTAAPIGICQTTPDGICLYTNARWQDIAGLSFADGLGDGWLQAIHPTDRSAFSASWEAFLRGQGAILAEFRLLTPQGVTRWVSAQAAAMRSAAGDIIGYVQTYEDVTARKLAEQKIREQAALLDITSDAILVRDLSDRILYWNQGAERLYGWSAAEAIGQSVRQLLNHEDFQLEPVVQTLLRAGEWRGEIHKVTKSGQRLTVESRWTLVRDESNQPKFILTVDTDVTEKQRLEAQFYRAQRLESLGTLASGIAHDLNNVLTPILSISQLLRLQQTQLDARSLEMLKVLEDSAKRGANMVKQILTFTRGTSGERRPLQVEPLLEEVIKVAQQTFPKSISIRPIAPAHPLWLIAADPTHLHQVLLNLCLNARDAMPHGGILTLTVENCFIDQAFAQRNLEAQVGNYIVITIADTGTGISPQIGDRIFEPFFTTKEPGQGTGLGLSTVLGIIKSYGGFLQVFSELGQGTQVKVYLPATVEAAGQGSLPAEPVQGNGELVLIVDDDPAVQQTNRALLESRHYTTLIANNGIEAIALYAQNRDQIRVILIDVMMPNMDGITAVRTLHKINPQVKILAISGLSTNRDPVLAAGATLFLSKPYTLEELLGNLQILLQS